MEENYTQ